MRSLVISIFLYACESWTLNKDLEKRISAFEMRCYRRIFGITYKDRITNIEVKSRIQKAIGPYEELDYCQEENSKMVWTCSKGWGPC